MGSIPHRLSLLIALLFACLQPASAAYTRSRAGGGELLLTQSPFTAGEDRDRDGINDEAEHLIARAYRPVFVFDSHENARNPNEPVVLYGVRPVDQGRRILINYAYLFAWDGGYGPSSWCGDSHDGDTQRIQVKVDVEQGGTRLRLYEVYNGNFNWPNYSMWMWNDTHPTAYLSAGKHHPFVDTFYDEKDSPYSDWGCNENMDARGAVVFPTLEHPAVPRGRMNVGEPSSHDPAYFVGDLTGVGYVGEHAWINRPFCGGRSTDCRGVSPVRSLFQ